MNSLAASDEKSEPLDESDSLLEGNGGFETLEEGEIEDLTIQGDSVESIEPLDSDETMSLDSVNDEEQEEFVSLDENSGFPDELLPADDNFSLEEAADQEIIQLNEDSDEQEDFLPAEEIEEDILPSEEVEIEEEEILPAEETEEEIEEIQEIGNEYEEISDEESETASDKEFVIEETDTNDSEYDDLSKFDYSTEIMPSIKDIEAGEGEEETEGAEEISEENETQDEAEVTDEESTYADAENNQEEIDGLFQGENAEMPSENTKKKTGILPLLGVLVVLGALGYYGYTKYMTGSGSLDKTPEPSMANVEKPILPTDNVAQQGDAMPNEAVEKPQSAASATNEAVSVEIPEIEQNLNASIEVSNLSVNWEVPVSYANNATAKRYFVKIGKVLQLNLKTEFLLLSTPPISNKITVELEYKFSADKIIQSSGVKSIDDLVKATLKKVLGMNMNVNMNVFDNLQGNPVLVIKL